MTEKDEMLEGFLNIGYEILERCPDGDIIIGKGPIIGRYQPRKKTITTWDQRYHKKKEDDVC